MTATLTAAYCLLFKKNAVQIQTNRGFYLQIRCDGEFFFCKFLSDQKQYRNYSNRFKI